MTVLHGGPEQSIGYTKASLLVMKHFSLSFADESIDLWELSA